MDQLKNHPCSDMIQFYAMDLKAGLKRKRETKAGHWVDKAEELDIILGDD